MLLELPPQTGWHHSSFPQAEPHPLQIDVVWRVLPAHSDLSRGLYLFALPTDQRESEILPLDLFVGPGGGGVEQASPRYHSIAPLGVKLHR